MRKSIFRNWHPIDLLLPLIVLFLLTLFTYGILFQAPYSGFYFNPSDGQVLQLYTPAAGALSVNDRLAQVGPVAQIYGENGGQELFVGVQPGQIVRLVVWRAGKLVDVDWKFPGFNRVEFLERLLNLWWLPYVFWLFGAIIQFVMRPKDTRWGLMVAANYLTSLWLAVGGLSAWRIWGSSIILHTLTWLLLPIYLALHWIFPRPLGRLPRWSGGLLTLAGILLALAELLGVLPHNAYAIGFFLTLFLSALFLFLHFFRQPEQRREVRLLLIAVLAALAPAISLSLLGIFGSIPQIGPLAFVALPIMPAAYFYSVYRRQLGGLEVRANWILSIYAFLIVVATLLILIVSPIIPAAITTEKAIFFTVTAATLTALCTALAFPLFQRFIEWRVLGIKLPHENLQETYAARIVTSTALSSLTRLLQDEVIPSLLIRQFVFLRLQAGAPQPLLIVGIGADSIPNGEALSGLSSRLGKYHLPVSDVLTDWVRLALPLKVGDELLGLWLLGRRDPDDAYSQLEIPVLQSLADQTAIALSNLLRAESLRSMYQTDIHRYEQERLRLAHELHDNVLNEMALLLMGPDASTLPPTFRQGFQQLTQSLRSIASDLRPPMLEYGLQTALMGLAENLMERTNDSVRIHLELLADDNERRYDEDIEQHVFRIIQQGCENALRHGHAKTIRISGKLEATQIILLLEDDGIGFDASRPLDLSALLAQKHFGMAGMYERAALIGANLKIDSAVEEGTRVHLVIGSLGD